MKFFVAGLAIFGGSIAAAAADPVTEFSRNYPAFQRGQFTVTERTTSDPKAPPDTVHVRYVWMDPPRWRILNKSSRTSEKDGKMSVYATQSEVLYPETGQIIVNANPGTGQIVGSVSAHIKPLPQEKAKVAGRGVFRFAIDGANLRNDQKTFVELLAESKTRTETASLNGHHVVIVHADSGEWGKLTLWLDPARNYLPLKVLQEKTSDHLIYDGKPLKSVEKNEDGKAVSLNTSTEQFETTRIEMIAGRNMVTAFTQRATGVWRDGSVSEESNLVSLSLIKPVAQWDKDPFVMHTVIPDGVRVTAQDDKPIEYEWRDGKIVKSVNQSVEQSSASFTRPARRWVWTIVAAGGALIVLLVWRVAARRKA